MEPGQVTLQALGQVLTSVGLSATLILFFVWQAWRREERTAAESVKREEHWVQEVEKREQQFDTREKRVVDRLQSIEDFTRSTLLQINERSLIAISQSTTANEASVEAIREISKDMKTHHAFTIESIRQMIAKT